MFRPSVKRRGILRRRVVELEYLEARREPAEELFQTLFAHSLIGIYIVQGGRFQFANPVFLELLGYSAGELLGTDPQKLVHPDDRNKVWENAVRMLKGERSSQYEYRVVSRSGETRWVLETVASIQYRGRRAALGNFMDITERKRMEEQIQHLNLILQAIRNVSQLIAREKDRDRLLEGICESLTETRGYHSAWIALFDESGGYVTSAEAGLSRGFLPMMKRLKRGELPDCAQRALEQADIVVIDNLLSNCTGCPLSSQHPQKGGAMAVRLAHAGKVYGLLVVSIPTKFVSDKEEHSLFQELAGDISFALHSLELEHKRRQAEEALQQSEENFRALAENSSNAISITYSSGRDTGRRVYVNSRLTELTGYTEDELLNLPLMEIVHTSERDRVADIRKRRLAGGPIPQRYETTLTTKDGKSTPVEATSTRTVWQGRPAFMTVLRDITERKRAEEASRELDRIKDDFFSNVSHELRTPLHSIKGFTTLMLRDKVPRAETQKEFLGIIDSQAEHLTRLIDNLLDMSRLESGRFLIDKQPLLIKDLTRKVIDGFYSLASEKGMTISEDIPEILPEVEADGERVSQVISNLLGNAIKFSEAGADVTVKCAVKDGELLVQVTDHGIGIPEEAIPHLFERFYRAEDEMARGGTGLGLYISKQIIEAHDGRIWAESTPGEGSTFSFILPLKQSGGNSHE